MNILIKEYEIKVEIEIVKNKRTNNVYQLLKLIHFVFFNIFIYVVVREQTVRGKTVGVPVV
jgi:hypothetical protein